MNLQRLVAIAIVMLVAAAQLAGGPLGTPGALASIIYGPASVRSVAAQGDNDDEDNEEEDDADNDAEDDADNDAEDDADNEDAEDNADADDNAGSDNEDADNDDSDNEEALDDEDDNVEDDDEAIDGYTEDEIDAMLADNMVPGDTAPPPATNPSAAAPPAAVASPVATAAPATGTTSGADLTIALGGERIVVKAFPWTPSGITLTLKPANPVTVTAAPGRQVGDLFFTIEARDATGSLTTLSGEVNLSVRYLDADVVGMDETAITMSRLDPSTNMWAPAAKLVTDPATNYIAASIVEMGTYAVHTP